MILLRGFRKQQHSFKNTELIVFIGCFCAYLLENKTRGISIFI